MYHIKNDKRALKSARIITDAVMEILRTKEFNDMTISDIERKSYVARSTFYRLFDNTVDVLAYKCDLTFDELITIHSENSNKTLNEVMITAGEYWMNNSLILEVLYRSGHHNVLQNSFERNFPRIVKTFMGDEKGSRISSPYESAVITTLISTALITWIEQGRRETAEELWEELKIAYKSIAFLME